MRNVSAFVLALTIGLFGAIAATANDHNAESGKARACCAADARRGKDSKCCTAEAACCKEQGCKMSESGACAADCPCCAGKEGCCAARHEGSGHNCRHEGVKGHGCQGKESQPTASAAGASCCDSGACCGAGSACCVGRA